MRLHVGQAACQAYGLCAELAPDLDVPAGAHDAARAAVGACPSRAPRLEGG